MKDELKTVRHLCEMLEWAKGLRGPTNGNPYGVPEVEAALRHLAEIQGIEDWIDAQTEVVDSSCECGRAGCIQGCGCECPCCTDVGCDSPVHAFQAPLSACLCPNTRDAYTCKTRH